MGLFDAFKKKEKPIAVRLTPEEIELRERLKKGDLLFEKTSAIEQKYKTNQNIDEYIAAYQALMADPEFASIKDIWNLRYPSTLIDAKRYNEACGALNQVLLHRKDLTGRVHYMFYEILKAEDRHHADAIFHLMVSYLLRDKGATSPICFYKENKRIFIKKAKPLGKKIGMSESEIEYCSYLIESQLSQKSFSITALDKKYKAFLKEKKAAQN